MLAFIRGIVRPIITFIGFGSLVGFLVLGIDIPDWYVALITSITVFWFATRAPNSSG